MLFFSGLSPSPTQHLRFTTFMTDSTVCHVTQGMDDNFLPHRGFFCPQSHTDSPFVGASDVGQESAYTGKL